MCRPKIVDLVTKFNNGWVYDASVADFGAKQLTALKLVVNGTDGYYGSFDDTRVQKVIDLDTPIFTKAGTPPKSGLKPSDLVTNEYLDTKIKL